MSCPLNGSTWFGNWTEGKLTGYSAGGMIFIPVLQLRKLRLAKVKGHGQVHLVKSKKELGFELGLLPKSAFLTLCSIAILL